MKIRLGFALIGLLPLAVCFASAADTFPTLQVAGATYSNVTVTTVTATDIYFSHTQGMGNAKLKDLSKDLQQRFKFDPAKGQQVEKQQSEATAQFHRTVAAQAQLDKLRPPPDEEVPPLETNAEGEPIAPKLYAKSFRGSPAPQIILEKWITLAPSYEGKFVLLNFWATSSEPCCKAIPHLNALQEKFNDRLVIIGLSDEPETDIKKLTEPRINYAIAIDTEGRTKELAEVRGIPHVILIDPKGIVRFEGLPLYLTESGLELLLSRYGK